MIENETTYCMDCDFYVFFRNIFSECTCMKKLCRILQAMIFFFCGKGGSRRVGKIMGTDNIIL